MCKFHSHHATFHSYSIWNQSSFKAVTNTSEWTIANLGLQDSLQGLPVPHQELSLPHQEPPYPQQFHLYISFFINNNHWNLDLRDLTDVTFHWIHDTHFILLTQIWCEWAKSTSSRCLVTWSNLTVISFTARCVVWQVTSRTDVGSLTPWVLRIFWQM